MPVVNLPNNPFVPPPDGRCLINDLPSELLSHIFTIGWAPERDDEDEEDEFDDVDEGASDEGSYSSRSSISDASSPTRGDDEDRKRKLPFNVLVSHVCARWRDVAMSNSLLWNHVSFVGPPPYDRALTYLARAATAPLALTIDRTADSDDEEDFSESDYDVNEDEHPARDDDRDLSIITGIMDVILPHIEHTQVLQIMVCFYPQMHRALEMLGACQGAPMLEVLQLYHYEDTDEHESFKWPDLRDQPFRLFGGNIPKLTHVALWGVHVDWSKEGAPYLTSLTDLEFAYHARDVRPSFKDFARILRTSPDLRTLTLCLSCPAGTPSEWPPGLPTDDDDAAITDLDPTAPLVFPKLTELVLAYLEPSYLLSLLPRLSLPALTSLALDLEDDDYSDLLAYLSSPRSLPQPPLPPLALRGPGVAGSPSARRSLLANLASLKIASLECTDTLVADAYRQLGSLTALNLNMLYLKDVWFYLLFPTPSPSSSPSPPSSPSPSSSPFPGMELKAELYLPRLVELTTTGVDGARMRTLVAARAQVGCPLRRVLMNQDDAVGDEDEAWLARHLERFEFFEGSDEDEDDDLGFDDEDEDDNDLGLELELELELGLGGDDGFDSEGDEWEDVDDEDDDEDVDEDGDGSGDEDGPEIVIP